MISGVDEVGQAASGVRAAVVAAWQSASDDLRLGALAPVVIDDVEFVARVPSFGSPSGVLVGLVGDGGRSRAAAEAEGCYLSMINPEVYSDYVRELFVEALSDWGWFGAVDERPGWLV